MRTEQVTELCRVRTIIPGKPRVAAEMGSDPPSTTPLNVEIRPGWGRRARGLLARVQLARGQGHPFWIYNHPLPWIP